MIDHSQEVHIIHDRSQWLFVRIVIDIIAVIEIIVVTVHCHYSL
jgi:hypothetical protein